AFPFPAFGTGLTSKSPDNSSPPAASRDRGSPDQLRSGGKPAACPTRLCRSWFPQSQLPRHAKLPACRRRVAILCAGSLPQCIDDSILLGVLVKRLYPTLSHDNPRRATV